MGVHSENFRSLGAPEAEIWPFLCGRNFQIRIRKYVKGHISAPTHPRDLKFSL